MVITLNEVIKMQQMMVVVGEKLIHSTIANPDMFATNVELLGEKWREYQSLDLGIQASLSFWELCKLRGMQKLMEI